MASLDLWTTLGAVRIERDVVRVEGAEAVEYLQGQLSQDIAALRVDGCAPALLLQPTGKVVAWVRVTRTGDDRFELDLEPGCGQAVLDRLARFRLRTAVDLDVERVDGWAVRGPGAIAPVGARPITWPGVEGHDLLGGAVRPDLPEASPESLEVLRIEAGVPANGAELTDATIPAEAGRWLIDGAVSFAKGCYTGQELVARVDSRGGNVPRPIRGLLVEGDPVPVGAPIVGEEKEVGTVTSSARSAALGAVALAPLLRAVEPGSTVVIDPAGARTSAVVADLPLR